MNKPEDLAVARHDPSRIQYLDGVRGLGALSVVLYHFIVLLAPLMGAEAIRGNGLGRRGPMLLVTNGSFYVKVFFVLSGFVLANSVASGRTPLAASVTTRYLRLTVPMTATLIFTWLVGATLPHPGSIPLPSLGNAITLGLWGVYRHGAPSSNFALWTMPFELAGSFAMYFCYKIPPRFRMLALLFLAALCLARTNALGFAVGAILRELHASGRLRWSAWNWLALLTYLFACSGPAFGLVPGPWQDRWEHNFVSGLSDTMGAAALILFVLTARLCQAVLQSRPCQLLAHLSFGLYLIHFPLLYPGAWVGSHLPGSMPERLLLTFFIFVGTSLVLGWLFTILIDDPLLLVLRRWKKGPLARWRIAGF